MLAHEFHQQPREADHLDVAVVGERRLRHRGKDSEATIAERLSNARDEILHADEFDYVIINKDFGVARQDLLAIVRSMRLRTGPVLNRLDGKLPEDTA